MFFFKISQNDALKKDATTQYHCSVQSWAIIKLNCEDVVDCT